MGAMELEVGYGRDPRADEDAHQGSRGGVSKDTMRTVFALTTETLPCVGAGRGGGAGAAPASVSFSLREFFLALRNPTGFFVLFWRGRV